MMKFANVWRIKYKKKREYRTEKEKRIRELEDKELMKLKCRVSNVESPIIFPYWFTAVYKCMGVCWCTDADYITVLSLFG